MIEYILCGEMQNENRYIGLPVQEVCRSFSFFRVKARKTPGEFSSLWLVRRSIYGLSTSECPASERDIFAKYRILNIASDKPRCCIRNHRSTKSHSYSNTIIYFSCSKICKEHSIFCKYVQITFVYRKKIL